MQGGGKSGRITNLTFPEDEDFPAEEAKIFEIAFVASNISPAFIVPEFCVLRSMPYSSGRFDPAKTTAVHMPETAVNEVYFWGWTMTAFG